MATLLSIPAQGKGWTELTPIHVGDWGHSHRIGNVYRLPERVQFIPQCTCLYRKGMLKKTVPSGSIPYFVRHANFFHDIFESEVEQIIACNKTI